MRTIASVLVVLALGASGIMLGSAGFEAAWGAEPPQTAAAQEDLQDSAANSSVSEGPVSGPVNSGESSIVGLIVDGIASIVSVAGAVILLPVTLINLGFPAWFALPIGALAELIVGIGIIQFATNRVWR